MNEKHIAQFEARLEQIVEGAFTQLLRKKLSAHDLAMTLARSMENNLRYPQDGDTRPIAPDKYTIHIHPETCKQFQQAGATLNAVLIQQMIELATQSEYRLLDTPIIKILPDSHLKTKEMQVHAHHTHPEDNSTQAMQPIRLKPDSKTPQNPQLIINDQRTITLTEPLVNIGRSDDNHIIIDDKTVSRHHLQIRLRFGVYTLFDVNSQGGTYINNVLVREHQLQAGDVIRIGKTQILYVTDDKGMNPDNTTQTLHPVDE